MRSPTIYYLSKTAAIFHTIFFKKNTDFCSKCKIADKLSTKLRKLIIVYQKNFYHA